MTKSGLLSFILLCSCSDHRKATKSIHRSYAACGNKQRTYNTYRIFSVRINYLTHQASLAIVSFGPFWESMRDEVGLVTAKCELPLVPARIQSIVHRTRAIDRFSCSRHSDAGQSERRAPPAPIRTTDWSSRRSGQTRTQVTQSRVTPEHERHNVISLRRLHFSQYVSPSR